MLTFSHFCAYYMNVDAFYAELFLFIVPIAGSPPTIWDVTTLWAFLLQREEVMGKNFEVRTAILVDGAYYRKRANSLAGYKDPKDRAEELERYCLDLLHDKYENRFLHRIFYYDCPPLEKGKKHLSSTFETDERFREKRYK